MTKTALLLFLFFLPFFSKSSNLDTISTWKIYYNDSLLKNINDTSSGSITIKRKEYKAGDYLTIQYFDDIPCPDCKYIFEVITEGKLEFSKIESKGTNKMAKIDLKELINFGLVGDKTLFIVYLYGPNDKKRGQRLVTLTIE